MRNTGYSKNYNTDLVGQYDNLCLTVCLFIIVNE